MNAEPHDHDPSLNRRWTEADPSWGNQWRITYGDTVVRVCNGRRTPTPRLVGKATRKAVRRHDTGSIRAGENENALDVARAEARRVAAEAAQEWANP